MEIRLHYIKMEKKKEFVRYEVDIGGDIQVEENLYSTARLNEDKTAFVVNFLLTCQGKSLKDAQLKCSVVKDDHHEKKRRAIRKKRKMMMMMMQLLARCLWPQMKMESIR